MKTVFVRRGCPYFILGRGMIVIIRVSRRRCIASGACRYPVFACGCMMDEIDRPRIIRRWSSFLQLVGKKTTSSGPRRWQWEVPCIPVTRSGRVRARSRRILRQCMICIAFGALVCAYLVHNLQSQGISLCPWKNEATKKQRGIPTALAEELGSACESPFFLFFRCCARSTSSSSNISCASLFFMFSEATLNALMS